MESIGSSSGKITPVKHDMAQVPGEAVCVIPKTEPGHYPIHLPYILL